MFVFISATMVVISRTSVEVGGMEWALMLLYMPTGKLFTFPVTMI